MPVITHLDLNVLLWLLRETSFVTSFVEQLISGALSNVANAGEKYMKQKLHIFARYIYCSQLVNSYCGYTMHGVPVRSDNIVDWCFFSDSQLPVAVKDEVVFSVALVKLDLCDSSLRVK